MVIQPSAINVLVIGLSSLIFLGLLRLFALAYPDNAASQAIAVVN